MSKRQVLVLLGLWVMILFALGIPSGVKQVLAIISGGLIMIVSYRLKPEIRQTKLGETSAYTEHKNDPTSPDKSVS